MKTRALVVVGSSDRSAGHDPQVRRRYQWCQAVPGPVPVREKAPPVTGQTTRSAQGVHLCICVTGAAAADPPADAADPTADADILLYAIRQH